MTDECAVLPVTGETLLGPAGRLRPRHRHGLTAPPTARNGPAARL
jgi:hypothetical protein